MGKAFGGWSSRSNDALGRSVERPYAIWTRTPTASTSEGGCRCVSGAPSEVGVVVLMALFAFVLWRRASNQDPRGM